MLPERGQDSSADEVQDSHLQSQRGRVFGYGRVGGRKGRPDDSFRSNHCGRNFSGSNIFIFVSNKKLVCPEAKLTHLYKVV